MVPLQMAMPQTSGAKMIFHTKRHAMRGAACKKSFLLLTRWSSVHQTLLVAYPAA
jgi:hypothetical protein